MSLAQGPSVTLGYIKRNINNAEKMSLEECFDAEAIHHSRCRRNRRPQGSGQGLRREAQAGVSGSIDRWREYIRLRQICLVAPHLEPVDLRHRRHHGARHLLPRRQGRKVRAGERAAAGRHHPAGSGGADASRNGGGALSRQDRQPRRLHGDLLLRGSGARGAKANAMGMRIANVITPRPIRHPAASARLPRRVHRVQSHRGQRRHARALSAGRAGLAKVRSARTRRWR